jgi:hypothetical protein
LSLTDGRRGGGRGAKSYDREQALPAINHSIFSAPKETSERLLTDNPHLAEDIPFEINNRVSCLLDRIRMSAVSLSNHFWLICRLLLEDNPFLTSVPYVVGCQQSLLSYSNQATRQDGSKAHLAV